MAENVYEKIFDYIDGHFNERLERLREYLSIASISPYIMWPTWVGGSPLWVFKRASLQLPFSITGLGHRGRSHQVNKYIAVEGLREGERYAAVLMCE